MRRLVLAHGGTASDPKQKDGTDAAVQAGLRLLEKEGPMAAVVEACSILEDDERFNAGTGSNLRFDGVTIEMDAAVMDSRRNYGAVSCIQQVKNPVRVAAALLEQPDNILGGDGATAFARAIGMKKYDPLTKAAKKRWEDLVEKIRKGEAGDGDNEWDLDALRKRWNYARPYEEIFGDETPPKARHKGRLGFVTDTIGAVATDGKTFAAAASTGGTITTLRGRIGDSPVIGAGIFAGEFGAVACTGNGNRLLRERAATMMHDWMGEGLSAQAAVRRFTAKFADTTDVWAAVIGLEDHAGGGNRDIAWSVAKE